MQVHTDLPETGPVRASVEGATILRWIELIVEFFYKLCLCAGGCHDETFRTTKLLCGQYPFARRSDLGGGFVAGKFALEGFSPIVIITARFCGSAILFGALFYKRFGKINRRTVVAGAVIGGVQFAALLVQLIALQYTSPMKQSFLAATYVVFTPFVAWVVTRRRLVKKDLIAALIALAGVGLISLNGNLSVQLGDVLTLAFAILFSFQIVLIERLGRGLDSITLTFVQFVSAGLLSVLAFFVTQAGASIGSVPNAAAYGIGYIVVINTALAICLQNYAQKRTSPNRAALILSLESVFGFIFSAVMYGEVITVRILAGCAFVMGAILLSKQRKERQGDMLQHEIRED